MSRISNENKLAVRLRNYCLPFFCIHKTSGFFYSQTKKTKVMKVFTRLSRRDVMEIQNLIVKIVKSIVSLLQSLRAISKYYF